MAKASLQVTVPVPPLTAFSLMGNAMRAVGVEPFNQEGWSLKGQENMGLFKMGWPVTVTGSVAEDGRGGSAISLLGENFGFALNRIHAEGTLRKIGEEILRAAGTMPPMPAMAPATTTDAPPVQSSGDAAPEDGSAPPRLG